MKIFYVANIRIPTEKAHGVAIARACEAFARKGIETTLIVPRRRTPFDKDLFQVYNIKPIFTVRMLPTVDLITKRAGQFVFWLQTLSFQLSLAIFLAFQLKDVVVYTREIQLMFLRHLGFKIVFECHLISTRRESFFATARKATAIVVISEALKASFIEHGFAPEKIVVAPSGVDLSVFDVAISKEEARSRLALPAAAKLAVYTGNFTTMGQDKGIADIICALEAAPEITFVAVGGSETDIERYRALAVERNVSDRVVLRGSTTQDTLAIYQKAADVLLMPFPDTPHYRNHMSPVKMFEYMAARRPVIASDLPTIREVLHEDTASIVAPGDIASLAKAMQDSCTDTKKSEALSQRAYADVGKYSWDARAERVLDFIQSLL